jgi:hypothetical protein
MSVGPNLSIFASWSKKQVVEFSCEQLNMVLKTIGIQVCLLNCEHVVDRHALHVIYWIGESVWQMNCHVLNYAIHKW